jgi:hypothetical protein
VYNLINKQKRSFPRENKSIFRPTPVKKVRTIIPQKYIEECHFVSSVKNHLRSLNRWAQLLLKPEPFANLEFLRGIILF